MCGVKHCATQTDAVFVHDHFFCKALIVQCISFSQEMTPEGGLEMYELVAHIPDRSTNYLGAALQTLEKNT